jgi:hypothetical protein
MNIDRFVIRIMYGLMIVQQEQQSLPSKQLLPVKKNIKPQADRGGNRISNPAPECERAYRSPAGYMIQIPVGGRSYKVP